MKKIASLSLCNEKGTMNNEEVRIVLHYILQCFGLELEMLKGTKRMQF